MIGGGKPQLSIITTIIVVVIVQKVAVLLSFHPQFVSPTMWRVQYTCAEAIKSASKQLFAPNW